jgi:putative FmdB family regulatory protein
MPIYAFECAACGHQFDRLQKLSDPDPRSCPDCSAESVRRQVTAPSFRLAGSGWYETDFKKDGDRKRNLAASEGGEGAKAGDAAKGGEGAKAASPGPRKRTRLRQRRTSPPNPSLPRLRTSPRPASPPPEGTSPPDAPPSPFGHFPRRAGEGTAGGHVN